MPSGKPPKNTSISCNSSIKSSSSKLGKSSEALLPSTSRMILMPSFLTDILCSCPSFTIFSSTVSFLLLETNCTLPSAIPTAMSLRSEEKTLSDEAPCQRISPSFIHVDKSIFSSQFMSTLCEISFLFRSMYPFPLKLISSCHSTFSTVKSVMIKN